MSTLSTAHLTAADAPPRADAERALRRAVEFFHDDVSSHGGYLWYYSGDLTLREAEGTATETQAWVQPPGTPTIGEAFLDAYEATGDEFYLNAARRSADVLVRGQLQSGGWDHGIELDPAKRQTHGYRNNDAYRPSRRKKNPTNRTSLDDDISQSAARFLMRLDKTLGFKDERLHEAVGYALDSMLRAQRPSGGWYQWWDRWPEPVSERKFPVKQASYPKDWSRKWLNDWTGRYYLNDDVAANSIETLLLAWETYGEERYLHGASQAGSFLLLAQMPDPQPAWAQQYNVEMHPVWDRKFEPPAISGLESQSVLETLLLLYRKTGEEKYLEPLPRALAYLKQSRLPDGRLARFYELETNRPLYFTRDYQLTYSADRVPRHYGFAFESRLDKIEAEYERLRNTDRAKRQTADDEKPPTLTPELIAETRRVIDRLDKRGAWVERGRHDYHDVEPESAIIRSATIVKYYETLCRFLAAQ
ncbi:MAG: hypothetical protein ACREIV_05515 [Planctomycetaceae bacterium]